MRTRRNHLSAESWLRGDNCSGRLNMWREGLVKLYPWHSFLNTLARCASYPQDCLVKPSNLGLGLVPELQIPEPFKLMSGEGKGQQYRQIGQHSHKSVKFPDFQWRQKALISGARDQNTFTTFLLHTICNECITGVQSLLKSFRT